MRSENEILNDCFCGNQSAIHFVRIIHDISHFYDDLIDRDKEITNEHIHRMFWWMLVSLQDNEFYCQNYQRLKPLVINSLIAYRTSCQYEQDQDKHGMEIGHVLRYDVANILTMTMYLCGGEEHANRHAPELYKLAINDRLDNYLREMTNHAENEKDVPTA